MKRILLTILAIILCLAAFSGCSKSAANYAFFSSYMLNSQDRNNPDDDVIEEMLLSNEALFAYAITKTETDTIQTVYVWHNLLRRELRLDIMQLYDAVPDKDKEITIKIDSEIIKINNMKRILLTILAMTLCFAAFSGCANNKYDSEWIIGKTSFEVIEKYGEFDCVHMPAGKDGLYRSKCGYTIEEQHKGFFGTSPEVLFYISFDENGVAVACEEGYRPGG